MTVKRGFRYDMPNGRMSCYVDGLDMIRMIPPATSGQTSVVQFGQTTANPVQLKIHNRDGTTASALEIRHRWVTRTPANNSIDAINYCRSATSMTSGYAYGISSQQWVESAYTVAGGYLAGIYGQLTVQGTMNGAGIVAAAIEGFISNGGTWTSVNILANLWLDTHLDRTPTAANGVHFIYCSNNGSASKCTYNSVIRVDAEAAITNLLAINNATGMVGANNAGDAAFANWKAIKVDIDGTTHYMIAAQTIT